MIENENIGSWVIAYVVQPIPVGVGKIVGLCFNQGVIQSYSIKFPWGVTNWSPTHCKSFKSREEAQKECDEFPFDKINYDYEG